MIEAVIFDMDGVLLDSEPFWQEAEMEVFASVGIQVTLEMCRENAGIPVRDIVEHRFQRTPWHGKSPDQVREEIEGKVVQRARQCAVPREGVAEALALIRKKNVPMALASSSPLRLITAVLEKLGFGNIFSIIHSAEHEAHGKPHPDVFLTTARLLRVTPDRCLVFEDSLNGLTAAKAANMKTVALPAVEQRNDRRFAIADLTLETLKGFTEEMWQVLAALP